MVRGIEDGGLAGDGEGAYKNKKKIQGCIGWVNMGGGGRKPEVLRAMVKVPKTTRRRRYKGA